MIKDKKQIEKKIKENKRTAWIPLILLVVFEAYYLLLAAMGGPPGITIFVLGNTIILAACLVFFQIEHRYLCIRENL